MTSSSRTLVPAFALAAVLAVNGAAPPAQPDPDATGTATESVSRERAELRPTQETVPAEKRPVRVILPSPYSGKR
jgi:hypothetical protein